MDEIDRRILNMLMEDGRISYRDIARELGIAVGTVHNRIKKLEESGILKGFLPIVDYEKAGYGLTAIIGIQARGSRIVEIEKLIARDPHVTCVYDVTGNYDIIIIAKFRDRRDMNTFVKSLLGIEGVEKTTTHVAMEIVKEDMRIEV